MTIKKIETLEDIELFTQAIKEELGLAFHPDDNFDDYINSETKKAKYTADEAKCRNTLLEQAFEVCNKVSVDIYEVMGRTIVKGTIFEKMFD